MTLTFAPTLFLLITLLCSSPLFISSADVAHKAGNSSAANLLYHRPALSGSLCKQLITPSGYPCSEHSVQTKDGFVLALQRVSSSSSNNPRLRRGPPVLLVHGLFVAGDVWFLNSKDESLGYILADQGYDLWVLNGRATRWSHGHVSLSNSSEAYWNWTWVELALYDLAATIDYVYQETSSKMFIVGHSQGTIISYAALTQPDIVKKVEAAALLSPISYLDHIGSTLVREIVNFYLDELIATMGFHEFNLRSDSGYRLLEYVCDNNYINCNNVMSLYTGNNSWLNNTRLDFYLEYVPHSTSVKNLNHLAQMVRQGTFAKYDNGYVENLKVYGSLKPPSFDLSQIPESLPMFIAHGSEDAIADPTDVQRTLKELPCKKDVIYLDNYGHFDFAVGIRAKDDVYPKLIEFFSSRGNSSNF